MKLFEHKTQTGRRLLESRQDETIAQTIKRIKTEFPQLDFLLKSPTIMQVRLANSTHRGLYCDISVATVIPEMSTDEKKKVFGADKLTVVTTDIVGRLNFFLYAKNASDKMMSQKYSNSSYVGWKGFHHAHKPNLEAVQNLVLKNGFTLDNKATQFRFRDKTALAYVKEFPNIEKAEQFLQKFLKDFVKIEAGVGANEGGKSLAEIFG